MALVLPHPHMCGHVVSVAMPGPHDTADSQYEQAAVDSGFSATFSYTAYIVRVMQKLPLSCKL